MQARPRALRALPSHRGDHRRAAAPQFGHLRLALFLVGRDGDRIGRAAAPPRCCSPTPRHETPSSDPARPPPATGPAARAPGNTRCLMHAARQRFARASRRLVAGTHLSAHCGPSNFRLRCHLGLVVPPGVRIRVGDEVTRMTHCNRRGGSRPRFAHTIARHRCYAMRSRVARTAPRVGGGGVVLRRAGRGRRDGGCGGWAGRRVYNVVCHARAAATPLPVPAAALRHVRRAPSQLAIVPLACRPQRQ